MAEEQDVIDALDEIIGEPHNINEVGWKTTDEEKRRIFIFRFLVSPDLDPKVLVENMELYYKWLKDGEVPTKVFKGKF